MQRVTEYFRMQPGHNDHHPALRTAVGVGVPLLTLLLVGRLDLAVFAAFGAFTGIYSRNTHHRSRLREQTLAGGLLLVFIFAGQITSHSNAGPWVIVAGASVVSGLGALGTGLGRLRPAGSLFHIFAYGAIASIPHQAPIWQGMLVAIIVVVFNLFVGLSTRLIPSRRTPWVAKVREPLTAKGRRTVYLESAQYFVAAAVAGSIATAMGIGHNYWAMVAAVVPLVGATVNHRVERGLNRILGTAAGLLVTAAILLADPAPWAMVLLIAVLQFAAEMYVLRHYALAQIFITPLALISTELAHHSEPGPLITDRAVETFIGAVVGIVVVVTMHYRRPTATVA
ncbi:FUSC family protein [Pseudarthrobacter sp. J1763]|uniref:FUSC family protein n=1 Tax=Pseudarthrobacter sp. J1763 TaxID=3420445 RepID=UPI003D284D15